MRPVGSGSDVEAAGRGGREGREGGPTTDALLCSSHAAGPASIASLKLKHLALTSFQHNTISPPSFWGPNSNSKSNSLLLGGFVEMTPLSSSPCRRLSFRHDRQSGHLESIDILNKIQKKSPKETTKNVVIVWYAGFHSMLLSS